MRRLAWLRLGKADLAFLLGLLPAFGWHSEDRGSLLPYQRRIHLA